jgi:twitching motility protein PilU
VPCDLAREQAVEILLNTRNISELIEKGEISEIKEALEKSLAPGSQTFEQALFKLFMEGKITQEEALTNADSASNMLWLINQATAGELSLSGAATPSPRAPDDKKDGLLSGGGASFHDFKLDVNA